MLFNVPQYIDVEDKIAGPLTARQLLWMIGMGAVLMVMWNIFDQAAFYLLAIPVVGIFCAFAFFRPYGQPLISFVTSAAMFIFRPKLYVWDRPVRNVTRRKVEPEKLVFKEQNTTITLDQIRAAAQKVDTRR